MLKRFSNIQLLIVFAILLGLIGLVKVYDSRRIDWNAVSQFVKIDTTGMDRVVLLEGDSVWLVKGDPTQWTMVDYLLPSEASFTVFQTDSGWTMGGLPIDSARTWKFLNELKQVAASTQFTGLENERLIHPEYKLTLATTTDTTVVSCYIRNGLYVMESSLQPGRQYDGQGGKLFEQVFVGRARFFPKE